MEWKKKKQDRNKHEITETKMRMTQNKNKIIEQKTGEGL